MTDSNAFVPPTGPSDLPDDLSAPPEPDAAPPTARAGGRRWPPVLLIVAIAALGIAAISFVFVVSVIGAAWTYNAPVVTAGETTQPAPTPTPLPPLMTGDPGVPTAVEPLVCAQCLDVEHAESFATRVDSYEELGVVVWDGVVDTFKVYAAQLDAIRGWREDGGSPEACYFTYSVASLPVTSVPVPTAVRLQDLVYIGWHHDESGRSDLYEVIRVFDSSESAGAHLTEVAAARDSCTGYLLSELGSSARVTPAPALALPSSVAASGWVAESGNWRTYVFELQRGNLVARLSLTTVGAGVDEEAFRAYVLGFADALAALEPSTLPG